MRIKLSILNLCLLFFMACSHADPTFERSESNVIVLDPTPTQVREALEETPEQKAVRLAEEHIARNGYTKAEADRENLSFETVEFWRNIDEMLESRHDTLNPKAYGIFYGGRSDSKKGWTIAFEVSDRIKADKAKRPNEPYSKYPVGRAVSMNEKFEDLLVEHKDVFLDKVDKVLD